MATRIGVMEDGKLRQVGTPAEIYENPASRFVAEFLGAANILPARVSGRDGQGSLLDVYGHPVRAAATPPPGDAVLLAIRPERLRLLPADAAVAENRLPGTVTLSAYAGDTLLHTVRLGDGAELRVNAPLGDGLAAARLAPGTKVTLAWPPEACILLPA